MGKDAMWQTPVAEPGRPLGSGKGYAICSGESYSFWKIILCTDHHALGSVRHARSDVGQAQSITSSDGSGAPGPSVNRTGGHQSTKLHEQAGCPHQSLSLTQV